MRSLIKQLGLAFAAGVLTPLLVALYLGGETLAQAGLRLTAIEQGFALASRHWQFEASPAHETVVAQIEEPAGAKKPARRQPRR